MTTALPADTWDDDAPCVICGRRPCFTRLGLPDDTSGAPAGYYCSDDAERLAEVDDLNADQYATTAADRGMLAAALSLALPTMDAEHAEQARAILARFARPAVTL